MSSPPTPDVAVARLQATALSARCHNALFRLKQLKSLHDTLRKNSSEIRTAIRRDTGVSESEATAEVAFALEVVKEHYAGLDWEKALEQEYRLANNKDADDERKPWGVVYIEPERTHTPVYSAIVALSAALVAGNCVALKVSFSDMHVDQIPELTPGHIA
jgi:aldehyde dehydrogenase (NAD+)